MNREKTCLYLDKDSLKELRKLSEKTGAPVSELIRRAIKEYISKKDK
jgi:metal-responsive CopG/Arc/MetJ family transcriptional regulator